MATEEKAEVKKHTIKVVESLMDEEHEKSALELALSGFDKYQQFKDIALYVKKEFDKRYPTSGKATDGVYHCIVGRTFAASVSHETRSFIHLLVDLNHVIVFKSKESPFHLEGAV